MCASPLRPWRRALAVLTLSAGCYGQASLDLQGGVPDYSDPNPNPPPVQQDGSPDPAYDADTGLLIPGRTKSTSSFITDSGHVYSTALYLSGLNPAALKASGKGRNDRPPLTFIKKP
ncbi:hypothetical protein [Myxococcus sp. RHSTA-1-4]|uniref:hypothetical protein n=1 Tax=Myxococcus sp. RHSTA-1-4 TaxID=2874601 RepID=UPI001CBA7CFF|nr:hypothetical protein [Myxococcus sp. RHSTA-1-4]MBZ4423195.1 hypothetical protein [Myxococcus sp. RHSTA-1-4]